MKYDEDRSGTLEKKEIKKLILLAITQLSGGDDEDMEQMWADVFTNQDFDKVWKAADVDDSGELTPDELVKFIKLAAHL